MKTARTIQIGLPACCGGSAPRWRQVAEALSWEIDVGRLRPGMRVPASRTLARRLGLSRNTILAAYDELSSLGYLRGRVGDGSYVSARGARARPPIHERRQVVLDDPDGLPLIVYSSRSASIGSTRMARRAGR